MKKRMLLFALLLLAVTAGVKAQSLPGDSLVYGPGFSVVYNDSVRIWLLTKNNTGSGDTLTLELTTGNSAPLTGTLSASDSRLGYHLRSYVFAGLAPGLTYSAKVKKNGAVIRTSTIVTNSNQPGSFEFLSGGCGRIMDMTRCVDQVEGPLHNNGTPDIYKHMAGEGSDLMIWLGDAVYLFGLEHAQGMCSGMVNDWDNMDALFSRYYFNRQFYDTLVRAMPQLAITDNHDVGGNEFNKTMPTLGLSKQNFMNWWQNPRWMSNSQGQGLYSSYRYKDVEFFLLDNRSYRESTTSHLGPEQLAWLKTALQNSTAPFKVLISGTPAFNKAWGGRNFSITAQCDTLLRFIKANNIDGVMCYSADIHNQQFYGKYNDHTYPFFDILSGNLASDVGTGNTSVNPNADAIFNSNAQTYVRTNVYGNAGDRRYKIEYVSPEGVVYYGTVIHEDMLKSIDDSTKKVALSFSGNLDDASKYQRMSTANGLSYGPDKDGNLSSAAVFDGTASVTIPYSAELGMQDRTFSIAYWIKPGTTTINQYASVFSNAAPGSGYTIGLNAARNPVFINHATGTTYTATVKLKQDEWSHITWKYDNVKLQLSLYFRGQLVQKWTGVPAPLAAAANLLLGSNMENRYFNGSVDQFMIYGKLISDNLVQQLSGYQPHRGSAISMTGAQNVVIPSAQLNPVLNSSFTIEFWARATADPATGTKLMASNGRINNLTRGIALEFSDANKVNVAIGTNGSGWASITNPGNPFQVNEWNHIALTAVNNDSVYLYQNGTRIAAVPFTHYYDNTFNLSLGNATQYANTAAPLEMDELRIWSMPQSAESIRKRMHYKMTGAEPDLAFYYDFTGQANNTVVSTGSNTTALTLTGAALVSSSAPVAAVDSDYRMKVYGNWTIRKTANNGLSLEDPITLVSSNLVTAFKADSAFTQLSAADKTWYSNSSWEMDATDLPIGTLKMKLSQFLPQYDSIRSLASEYYLLKKDGTDMNIVNSGYFDGDNINFLNTFIDTGKYFLGWKADTSAVLFDRGGVLSMLGGHVIQVPYAGINNALSGPFTIEFWARLMKNNTENVKMLSNNGRVNNNSTGLSFELAANGGTVNSVTGLNSSGWTTINSGAPWQVGEWNHVALTGIPNNYLRLYINGKMVDSAAFIAYVPNQINLALGTSIYYGLESVGMMDELRIWKRAKTAAQITDQMHLSLAQGQDTSLVYNYTFNQLNGTYLKNSGTLNDSITYTNARIIPATSPIGRVSQPQQFHVTGNWSIRDSVNGGLSVLVSIPDYETNVILGKDNTGGSDSLANVPNGIRLKRLWQLDPLKVASGSFDFDGPAVFTTNWNLVKNDAIEYYLLKQDTAGQLSIQAVGNENNDKIVFNNINMGYGLYTLGWKSTNGIVLPLVWGYIRASYIDARRNLLSWQTIQEHDTRHFEIERSLNGRDFQLVGKVSASGNSNKPLSYSYTDEHGAANVPVYYYRIRLADIDGRISYSPVVRVTSKDAVSRFSIQIAPNPGAAEEMSVSLISGEDGWYSFVLSNVNGSVVWKKEMLLDQRPVKVLPKLAAGTYYLTVSGNGVADTRKIVVR